MVTGTAGSFVLAGLSNGSYTLTPSLAGYTFSPPSLGLVVNGANVVGQNFLGTAVSDGGAGHIYVTDRNGHSVIRMDDISGSGWRVLDAGVTSSVWGLYVDPLAIIYYTDSTSVVQTDINGSFSNRVSHNLANTDQFVGPEGVAVDSSNNIYVADWGTRDGGAIARIVQTDITGSTWNVLGGARGVTPGQFGCPGMIAVDSNVPPNLYIADRCNGRIVETTMSGSPWNVLTGSSDGGDQFKTPRGIAVEGGGVIWIADEQNNRVVRTTMSGNPWTSVLTAGGGGVTPTTLSVDPAGNVYVGSYFGPNILDQLNPSSVTWTVFTPDAARSLSSSNGVFFR